METGIGALFMLFDILYRKIRIKLKVEGEELESVTLIGLGLGRWVTSQTTKSPYVAALHCSST
jgi:hypothetical protein